VQPRDGEGRDKHRAAAQEEDAPRDGKESPQEHQAVSAAPHRAWSVRTGAAQARKHSCRAPAARLGGGQAAGWCAARRRPVGSYLWHATRQKKMKVRSRIATCDTDQKQNEPRFRALRNNGCSLPRANDLLSGLALHL